MGASILYAPLVVLIPLAVLVVWLIRKTDRLETANSWPICEGTIQSAGMEMIGRGRRAIVLPCFAFSYVVNGEYHSGRFALSARDEKASALIRELVNKKLTIHFDPEHPSTYFIPVELIEGCQVHQKLGSDLFGFYPND